LKKSIHFFPAIVFPLSTLLLVVLSRLLPFGANKEHYKALYYLREGSEEFKEHFGAYIAKDIVSWDFYWYGEAAVKKIFAAVDCKGHGAPGAFISLAGYNHCITL
jgi:hypothetical protein